MRAAKAATREGYLARYYTALCYYDGKGTNVDRAKAIEMMEAAAGIRLTEGGTEGDTPQGDTAPCTVDPDRLCGLACFFLGYLYEVGRDVSPDTDKAYELYRRGLKSKDPLIEMLEARDGLIDPSEEERSLDSDIERLSKEKDREQEYVKLQKELEKVVQDQEKISKACKGLSTKLHSFNTQQKQVDEATKAVTVQARSDIPYGTPDDGDSLPLRMGSVIEKERNKLVEFFNGKTAGIGWKQLDDYTRNSLLSACAFLAVSGEKDELDHSGACISASSALENELKLRFVDGYQRYLEDRVPTDQWPPFMQVCREGDSAIVTREWLSLNDTKKLYETQDDQKALKAYLRTIKRNEGYQDEVIFKSVLEILGECSDEELVRVRNGAGHTSTISFETAKKQTEKVQDLIKELMILTSIPGQP